MLKTTLFFILFSICIFSQPLLEENFDYAEGQLTDENSGANVSGGNWSHHSGTSGFIQVVNGSLSYSGYPSSGIGNKIQILSSQAEDVNSSFTTQSGDGTKIYASFLINISSTSTGDYFFHFRSGNSNKGRIWAKSISSGVDFGLSGDDSSPTYVGTEYLLNTTHLIVISYEFLAGDDEVNLWVDPDLSGAEPLPLISVAIGTDFSSLDKIAVRQSSDIPNCTIDGIRVATSWAQAPLPVELTSFTALAIDDQIRLNWKTASEVNNYGFDIERSISKNNSWNKVGFVEGHGNSNSEKQYNFIDKDVLTGSKYFYRLKEINTDGSFEYSKIVEAGLSVPLEFNLSQNYPNPFNPVTNIRFEFDKNSKARLTVYDILGNKVMSLFNGGAEAGKIYKIRFDGSMLSSGVYYYKLTGNSKTEIKKMLLLK